MIGSAPPAQPTDIKRQRAAQAMGLLVALIAWVVVPALASRMFYASFAGGLVLLALCLRAAGPSLPAARRVVCDFLTGGLMGLAGLTLVLNFADVAVQCWDYAVLRLGEVAIDGRELAKMAAIARGGSMYPPMTDYPFFITLYTPVYHYLGAFVSLFLPDVSLAAHCLTYAAHAALIVVMTVWIRAESGRLWAGLALALALVLSPYYGNYVLKTRPDLLAWFLAFLGAFVFSQNLDTLERKSSIPWAALLLSLALMTKQQTLPILLAMATVFVVKRGTFAVCLRLALWALAFCVAIYGYFYVSTDGNVVLHTVVYPSRLAGDPAITNLANAWPRLLDLGRTYWGLFLLYALALVGDLRRKRLHILDWAMLAQVPFLMTLLSTWGADGNYLLGFIMTVGIRAGIFLAAAKAGRYTNAVILAGLLLVLPALPARQALFANRPDAATVTAKTVALRNIAASGRTLVNSEGSNPFVTATPPVAVDYFDIADMAFFEDVKLFNFPASRLGLDIEEKCFDHIILSKTFVVPRYLRHILSAYEPVRTIGAYTVYAPRPGRRIAIPDLQQASVGGSVRVSVTETENMEFGQGFGARFAGSQSKTMPGRITLLVDSDQPMENVTLGYYPKVHPVVAENAVTIEWSCDGTTYKPLAHYAGMGDDTKTDLFSPALFASFSPEAAKFYIRFTLRGTGQVWSNDATPLTLTISQSPLAKPGA